MISLHVQVKPGAAKDGITLNQEGQWIVRIRARPIEGAANEYLLRYLEQELALPKSVIRLEKGATSRFKKIAIDISEDTFNQILARYKK